MALPITLTNGTTADADDVMSNFNYLDSKFVPWQDWTPTWTNLTVGNGTVTARYTQIGKLVTAKIGIKFGSTTSISGSVRFTLPVANVAMTDTPLSICGVCAMYQASPVGLWQGSIRTTDETEGTFLVSTANATYLLAEALSATVPFTWETDDYIIGTFTYEAA